MCQSQLLPPRFLDVVWISNATLKDRYTTNNIPEQKEEIVPRSGSASFFIFQGEILEVCEVVLRTKHKPINPSHLTSRKHTTNCSIVSERRTRKTIPSIADISHSAPTMVGHPSRDSVMLGFLYSKSSMVTRCEHHM